MIESRIMEQCQRQGCKEGLLMRRNLPNRKISWPIIFVILTLCIFAFQSKASAQTKNLTLKENKEASQDLYIPNLKFSSWGVQPQYEKSNINLQGVYKDFKAKREVVVAVVDTGIDYSHPYLKSNHYLPGVSNTNKEEFGMDFSKNSETPKAPHDLHGHGTHISGIIRSIFPKVKILSLKYYNPAVKNKDNLDSTIKALEYAIEQKVDIINYSSGGAGASIDELRVLKKAQKAGILVVAAAGNEASNIDEKENFYFPASYRLKNMITVINHDQNGKLNPSSNWGAKSADLSAPGSKIRSAYPASSSGFLTGTSQSTAFVSGVAALLMSAYPEATIEQVKEMILKGSRESKDLKDKCHTGAMLDAQLAYNFGRSLFQSESRPNIATKQPRENRAIARKPSKKTEYAVQK